MKKKKEFDCVEMKNQIQRKILIECNGMTPEERHKKLQRDIYKDKEFYSLLSRFKIRKLHESS
jgi:hypothetical protein